MCVDAFACQKCITPHWDLTKLVDRCSVSLYCLSSFREIRTVIWNIVSYLNAPAHAHSLRFRHRWRARSYLLTNQGSSSVPRVLHIISNGRKIRSEYILSLLKIIYAYMMGFWPHKRVPKLSCGRYARGYDERWGLSSSEWSMAGLLRPFIRADNKYRYIRPGVRLKCDAFAQESCLVTTTSRYETSCGDPVIPQRPCQVIPLGEFTKSIQNLPGSLPHEYMHHRERPNG